MDKLNAFNFCNAIKNVSNFQTERKEFLKQKLSLIIDDIEKSKDIKPDKIMYTTEFSMSIVDPSYIYDKSVGGVKKVKLFNRVPKNSEEVLELGFSKSGRCLYEKLLDRDYLWATYIYAKKTIYRIYLSDFMYSSIYEFDEFDRVKFIQRGYEMIEEYQWLNDDVAIVNSQINGDLTKYLLLKNKNDVLAIFNLCDSNDIDTVEMKDTKYIELPTTTVKYNNLYKNCKNTQFYKISCLNQKYRGRLIFKKYHKNFSYQKSKELFKKIVLENIEIELKKCQFSVSTIGILFNNEGYDIEDVFIGFDNKDSYEVLMMKRTFQVDFDPYYEDIISFNDYIQKKHFYNEFRVLIHQIEKEVIEKYHVTVLLEEIND